MRALRLSRGDVVATVSPSFPALGLFPHRLVQAEVNLRRHFDLKLRPSAHALKVTGWVAGSPEERAGDMHAAFSDPEVRAIITGIGGDHSSQLLRHLDWDLLAAHPKIFVGYSDITVLCLAIHHVTGLTTFYGPAIATPLGEYPDILPYTLEHFERALFRPKPVGRIHAAAEWTEEFLNWNERLDTTRPRRLMPNAGPVWIRRGMARGPLMGGCLESFEHLRGTRFWPDFRGAILFWELSEGAPSPSRVDAILSDLQNLGALQSLAGMLIGRPYRYPAVDLPLLWDVVRAHTEGYGYPVLANLDFGHTDPVVTIPIGVMGSIDEDGWSIVERGVD